MRVLPILAAFFVSVSSASAAVIPIDLNDFFADPEVTVSFDGTSASFVERQFNPVYLSNDPGLGDPEVIVAAANRTLSFDYQFNEPSGNVDSFSAVVIDASTGFAVSPAFRFSTSSTGSGTVSFDLSSLTGTTLGLVFELESLFVDLADTSTLTVSNVVLIDEMEVVPLPASLPILFGGLMALGLVRTRRKV